MRIRNIVIILILFWMSAPVAPLIPNLDENLETLYSIRSRSVGILAEDIDSEFLRSLWIPVYLAILAVVVRDARAVMNCFLQNWLIICLLGWSFISTLWSVSPDDTIRRAFALTVCTIFGIYLGTSLGTFETIRLLAAAMVLGMVASVVCALAFPAVGISGYGSYIGAWRGVYANKNSLGGTMLKAIIAFWFLYQFQKKGWYLVGLGFAIALLLASTAKTPIVVLAAIVIILMTAGSFLRNPQRLGVSLGFGISSLALMFLMVVPVVNLIATLLDRDLTLTGRTDIWLLTWQVIQSRFWIGYGYAAFWSNPYGPATLIWDPLNWRVPNSHSGVLELWLALGLIGVALFGAFIVSSCVAMFRQSRSTPYSEVACWLTITAMFLIYSITESSSMEHNSLGWVLFTAVIAASGRAQLVARSQREAALAAPLWRNKRSRGGNAVPAPQGH